MFNKIIQTEYPDLAKLVKVLNNPTRSAILDVLMDGEHRVCRLEAFHQDQGRE
jgi:DNA-binding transcriptional ArsR family regulator